MCFVGFDCLMLTIHVLHACVSLLSIIPCLCCVVHFMLMVKCLIDISFVTVDFMVYNVCRDDLLSMIINFFLDI